MHFILKKNFHLFLFTKLRFCIENCIYFFRLKFFRYIDHPLFFFSVSELTIRKIYFIRKIVSGHKNTRWPYLKSQTKTTQKKHFVKTKLSAKSTQKIEFIKTKKLFNQCTRLLSRFGTVFIQMISVNTLWYWYVFFV